MNNDKLIKETGLNEKDLFELKEKFIEKYSKFKGWDKNKLTPEQLNEIAQQPEYKSPGLLLS
ncbi:MAG: hypothetical protein ACOC3V_01925 [bacterium]